MSKYPTEITDKILQKNEHILDEHIRSDISATQAEIDSLRKAAKGHGLIADANPSCPSGKMAYFRQQGCLAGVQQRQEFVEFLQKLLDKRQETAVNKANGNHVA